MIKRVTIKDLAAELDTTPSTVSRALADNHQVSLEMKMRVRELASKRNYQPNQRAKSLRTRRTDTIALILPEINAFFVPEMMYGINTAAAKHHFSVIMFQSDNRLDREKELLRYAHSLDVDGVLLSVSEETTDATHIDAIRQTGTPILLIDKLAADATLPGVTIDGFDAAYRAGIYLSEQGHKRLIGIFGNPSLSMTAQRRAGFERAMLLTGLYSDDSCLVEVEQILELPGVLDRVLRDYSDATAIFVMSDELMVHTHFELTRRGLSIPLDFSLMAISDGFAPYYLYPNITHIHHSGFEVGHAATMMLIGTIHGTPDNPKRRILVAPLCELDSVVKLKQS
jgi:LacI family transcriptional regulator